MGRSSPLPTTAAIGAVTVAVVLATMGCSGSGSTANQGNGSGGSTTAGSDGIKFRDWCSQRAVCEGGNDMDIDACVVGVEAQRDEASAYCCTLTSTAS